MHAAQKPFTWFILSTGAAPFVLGGAMSWGSALSTAAASQSSSSVATLKTGEYIHYNILRTAVRTPNGRFAVGNAQKVDLGIKYNLSRATPWTPTNTSIPTWAKWAAGVGGGSVLVNQILNHDK